MNDRLDLTPSDEIENDCKLTLASGNNIPCSEIAIQRLIREFSENRIREIVRSACQTDQECDQIMAQAIEAEKQIRNQPKKPLTSKVSWHIVEAEKQRQETTARIAGTLNFLLDPQIEYRNWSDYKNRLFKALEDVEYAIGFCEFDEQILIQISNAITKYYEMFCKKVETADSQKTTNILEAEIRSSFPKTFDFINQAPPELKTQVS